jgi:hypothetical protein
MKIGVTEQAVVKRLKRALLTKSQYLRVADGRKQKRWGFGRYYLLDAKGVVDKDVNTKRLAQQLGVVLPRGTRKADLPLNSGAVGEAGGLAPQVFPTDNIGSINHINS